jgi:hypothetical protein
LRFSDAAGAAGTAANWLGFVLVVSRVVVAGAVLGFSVSLALSVYLMARLK